MLCHTLRRLRENSKYTQQQVADALSIDRSTYAYYETGKTTPDINTIIKLSKIFNVPYTDIFESEDDSTHSRFSDVASNKEWDSSKNGKKTSQYVYELKKREQQVIIAYRLLNKEQQEQFLLDIYKRIQGIPGKKKAKNF